MQATHSGRRLGAILLLLIPLAAAAAKDTAIPADISAKSLEMLKRSVGFKTVKGEGQVPAYAEYLAGELKAHGFADEDVRITPMGETATLTAVYRGSDPKLKPLLVASHMDVVVARREDWERDPFTAGVENGLMFGRGCNDSQVRLVTPLTADL